MNFDEVTFLNPLSLIWKLLLEPLKWFLWTQFAGREVEESSFLNCLTSTLFQHLPSLITVIHLLATLFCVTLEWHPQHFNVLSSNVAALIMHIEYLMHCGLLPSLWWNTQGLSRIQTANRWPHGSVSNPLFSPDYAAPAAGHRVRRGYRRERLVQAEQGHRTGTPSKTLDLAKVSADKKLALF